MKNHVFALFAFLLSTALPQAALAQEKSDYIVLSAGYYDTFGEEEALDLRAEYRPAKEISGIKNLQPWGGIEITHESSFWVGGGLLYDLQVTDNVYVTPSAGLGIYGQGDSELDLDFPVIVRTQIEAAYQYDNKARAGLGISHLSNVGMGNDNPGTEVISVNLGLPF